MNSRTPKLSNKQESSEPTSRGIGFMLRALSHRNYQLFFGGLGCIIGALWVATSLPALRREVRPIYVKIGILPEMAAGIQNTSELSVPPET